jgi:four helix bundle protein
MQKGTKEQRDKGTRKGKMKTYRDLLVWQKSMALVTEIYRLSKSFPKDETYGLTSQMRRCAVSIPSNMAEGYGRNSTSDYIRFLYIATGSLYELQTHIEIALNLRYLNKTNFDKLYESSREIERMLSSLTKKLNDKRLT